MRLLSSAPLQRLPINYRILQALELVFLSAASLTSTLVVIAFAVSLKSTPSSFARRARTLNTAEGVPG